MRELDDVAGWFRRTDQLVMDWLLRYQERAGISGDLLEMGAYLGKSAILIGFHRRPDERVVICDLFGQEPPTADNRRAVTFYTEKLTREAFESNYGAFHADPPHVIQAPTSALPDHLAAGSCRFAHVDACHLYDVVRGDIEIVHDLLTAEGIVVFDDIRSAHTPGVAAAVWPEVVMGGLRVICITPSKLYATWGEADPIQDSLLAWLEAHEGSSYEVQSVAGRRLVRIADWRPAPRSPVPLARHAPPLPRRRVPAGAKRLIAELLPPILTRGVRRLRRRAR